MYVCMYGLMEGWLIDWWVLLVTAMLPLVSGQQSVHTPPPPPPPPLKSKPNHTHHTFLLSNPTFCVLRANTVTSTLIIPAGTVTKRHLSFHALSYIGS